MFARGDRSPQLDAFHVTGLNAYKDRLPYAGLKAYTQQSSDVALAEEEESRYLCIPVLLFIALTISLSKTSHFSSDKLEILLTFIAEIYPDIIKLRLHCSDLLTPAKLVLRALLDKLDPISMGRVHKLLAITTEAKLDFLNIYETSTISCIMSHVWYLQSFNIPMTTWISTRSTAVY